MTSPNISGVNRGPNSSNVSTPQALMGPRLSSPIFDKSVTGALAVGPLSNLGASILGPKYVSGLTNRLIVAAATNAGNGTQIGGIDASGVSDGLTILIVNTSATDPLIFNHLDSGSLPTNQFSNQNAGQVQIPPLGAARATYVINVWQFA